MVVPKPCTGEGVFPPLVSWGVILFHQGFEKKESFLNLLLNLSGPDSDGSRYCLSVLPFLPQCWLGSVSGIWIAQIGRRAWWATVSSKGKCQLPTDAPPSWGHRLSCPVAQDSPGWGLGLCLRCVSREECPLLAVSWPAWTWKGPGARGSGLGPAGASVCSALGSAGSPTLRWP